MRPSLAALGLFALVSGSSVPPVDPVASSPFSAPLVASSDPFPFCASSHRFFRQQQGSQSSYILPLEQQESAFLLASCCDPLEDMWLVIDDMIYDVGVLERPQIVHLDLLRSASLAQQQHALFTAPFFVHSHPFLGSFSPPSPLDYITMTVQSLRFYGPYDSLGYSFVYDCSGVWQFRLSDALADSLELLSGEPALSYLPEQKYLEDLLLPLLVSLHNSPDPASTRLATYLSSVRALGIELSYTPLDPL